MDSTSCMRYVYSQSWRSVSRLPWHEQFPVRRRDPAAAPPCPIRPAWRRAVVGSSSAPNTLCSHPHKIPQESSKTTGCPRQMLSKKLSISTTKCILNMQVYPIFTVVLVLALLLRGRVHSAGSSASLLLSYLVSIYDITLLCYACKCVHAHLHRSQDADRCSYCTVKSPRVYSSEEDAYYN